MSATTAKESNEPACIQHDHRSRAMRHSISAAIENAPLGSKQSATFSDVTASLTVPLAFTLLTAWKNYQRIPRNGSREAKGCLPLVILGNSECARDTLRALLKRTDHHRQIGDREFRLLTVCPDAGQQWAAGEQLKFVESAIEHAILALPEKCDWETQQLFEKAARTFKHLSIAPRYPADEEDVAGCWPPTHEGNESRPGHQLYTPKRLVDLSAAVLLGLLTLPVFVLTALAVRFSSQGPVFYKQARIGRGNKVFTAFKFRTMRTNADEMLNGYLRGDPALREQWESVKKLKNDPRVTPVGRFLRRFSLDELPQLWNVFVGDMSLIGPRPIVIAEVEKYGRHYAAYECVRPGLTGLWQVSGRNDTTYQARVEYDSYYVRNWSPWLDTKIFLKTFRAVISGVGAY